MYLRSVHAENSLPVLQQLVRDNPLGILTTALANSKYPLIQASHIPWVLDVPTAGHADQSTSPGVLRGHLARANPQAKALIEAAQASADGRTLDTEVMVLFHGPAHSYVTPKFYVSTKPDTGKVVPTWNYAAAQAYGRITVYHDTSDARSDAFLSSQIADLSEQQERAMGFERTWKVSDAPGRYIDMLKKAILGVEIQLDRLEGKFKMSQELSPADREGVVQGFKQLGTETGEAVSQLVQTCSPLGTTA